MGISMSLSDSQQVMVVPLEMTTVQAILRRRHLDKVLPECEAALMLENPVLGRHEQSAIASRYLPPMEQSIQSVYRYV